LTGTKVTNREYREFVNRGGYWDRELWKIPFVKDGHTLSWEQAMREFVDPTGRPGPATWEAGSYSSGQDNYPVSGVSWYEAAAYAEFAGKRHSAGDVADMQTIQNAGTQAGADLQLIASLIAAYQKADAATQPGILNQIESAINAAQGSLQGLLPALHIKDAATQAKITAVIGIVLSEVESLAAILPMVKTSAENPTPSTSSGQALAAKNAARVVQPQLGKVPLSASQFVASFNATLTAKTGNADLDKATAGLEIHRHGKVARWVSGGMLR